jgi:hypothetical protein
VRNAIASVGLLLACAGLAAAKESREEKVRRDRARVEEKGYWIYDDVARGLAEAKASGKPLAVALRCIPCEECVRLDDDLLDADPRLRPLLDRFVRVRVVSANGLDLSLFQFDTDQSWLVFLLRDDGTVYGRFGTRSHRNEWSDDVSVEGLARALEGALELHDAWPRDREALRGKRGPAPAFPSPEKYPSLAGRYGPTPDREGDVVRSCIHCHMIGEAERAHRRGADGKIPEDVLFPFPHPRAVGLVLDPAQRARVARVEPGSPAEAAGLREGDVLRVLDGQPMLSIADVQWVLHRTPPGGGTVRARVVRGDSVLDADVRLPAGWRREDDLSWRASTWDLRRMALGGMKVGAAGEAERAAAGLPADARVLRVEHVGRYAPHDRALRAGVRTGDLVLSVDGRSDFARETDLLRYALDDVAPGAAIAVKVRRGAETIDLSVTTAR